MSNNPLNLAVRFLLEMSALVILGVWGWTIGSSVFRYVLALALPSMAAAAWGTFRVPGDASHSGGAPVPIPGMLRLMLELLLFAGATWALVALGRTSLAQIFGGFAALHYLLSWDRILWLLRST